VYLIKDNYTYKNNVGKIENVEMAFEIKSEFRGKNQTPFDGSLKEHSPNENVIVTTNSKMNDVDRAKNAAHELYGHAELFSKGKDHKHQYVNEDGKFIEKNQDLKIQIKGRTEETIKNILENEK
jgi:hypothetical protein